MQVLLARPKFHSCFNIVVIQKLVSEKDRMSSSTKPYSKWRDVRVQVMLILKIVCYRLGLSL